MISSPRALAEAMLPALLVFEAGRRQGITGARAAMIRMIRKVRENDKREIMDGIFRVKWRGGLSLKIARRWRRWHRQIALW